MLTTGFQRMRSYIRQGLSRLHTYTTRLRNRQVEPWNETQESKRAEREEVVAVCFPISRIKVQGCLSGDGEYGNLLETLEVFQDNGDFKRHDSLVQYFIDLCEEKDECSIVWVLKIEESATHSYQGNWEHAKKLLESVINSDLPVEHPDVIKARAYYLLVAHMRRNQEYSKSNIDLLFEYLERSVHLLHKYDLPGDWAELYQTYGCVWMDRMNQLPFDERNSARENAVDCFYRAIYYSEQTSRKRVQMKRQSYVHLKFAMLHLGCCSTFPLAQENHSPLNDIKEAKRHLGIIKSKFGKTIPKATKMLFSKTKSDLCYRLGKYQLAKKKAEKAHKCALDNGFNTELKTLQERKDFYQKKRATRFRGFIKGRESGK